MPLLRIEVDIVRSDRVEIGSHRWLYGLDTKFVGTFAPEPEDAPDR